MYQPDHGRKARARSVEAHVAQYDVDLALARYLDLMQIGRAVRARWNDEWLAKVIMEEGQGTGLDSPFCSVVRI